MYEATPILTAEDARWSHSLGKWAGVPVRFHSYFIAVLVVLLIFAASPGEANRVSIVLMAFVIWVASAILHEVAHVYVCRQFGGVVHLVVFSPLGGQSLFSTRGGPLRTMMVYAAGPLANLGVALTAMVFLWDEPQIKLLLNPFEPRTLTEGPLDLISLKLFFFLNWFIFLANLLPVFPLDAGHILCEAIRIEPPTSRGPDLATEFVARWSVLASAGAFAAAIWQFALGPYWHIPTWFVFASFGGYFFFGAKESLARCQLSRRRLPTSHSARLVNHDDPSNSDSVDSARIDRWLRERLTRDSGEMSHQAMTVEDEELRVDQALEALHQVGYEGLSPQDRELLRRASERYRQKHRRGNSDNP